MTDMDHFLELVLEKEEGEGEVKGTEGSVNIGKRNAGDIEEKVCPLHHLL